MEKRRAADNVEQFHPKDEYEGYFSPCKMPSKLYKTLKSPAAKKKDYLFGRINVETMLFNASADLCAAIRPILEVLSELTKIDPAIVKVLSKNFKIDVGLLKNLLGHGIIGIFSANIKISRGPREIYSKTFCKT